MFIKSTIIGPGGQIFGGHRPVDKIETDHQIGEERDECEECTHLASKSQQLQLRIEVCNKHLYRYPSTSIF